MQGSGGCFRGLHRIDWADQRHAWAMQIPDGTLLEGELTHTPEAVEAWAMELATRFNGQPIAVALEKLA